MYDTRDAASNWEDCYTQFNVKIEFTPGVLCACAFDHGSRDIHFVINGDDLTYLGCDEDLDWLQTEICQRVRDKDQKLPGTREL